MDYFDAIYETMIDQVRPEFAVPWVENAFSDGSYCDTVYDDVRTIYAQLCERLGTGDEDSDLDAIIERMEQIQRDLCRKMYVLGYEMGYRDYYGDE